MIIAILPIFRSLWIIDMSKMIAVINTIRVIILIIVTITIIMAINHKIESVIFMAKMVVTLISIQIISNRKQKNFGDKTENFVEIRANITHF